MPKPTIIKKFNLEEMLDRDTDDTPLTFGKYAGKTPNEVSTFDPNYIIWMFENVQHPPITVDLYELCKEDQMDNPSFMDEDDFFSMLHGRG